MKKIVLGLTILVMSLSLTGCKENPKLKNGEESLVTFNEKKLNISVDDLYNILKDKVGINYLIELIDGKILNKIYKTDEIAKKSVDDQIDMYDMYYGGRESLLKMLQSSGFQTIEEFKESLLINYKRNLALKDYVRESITKHDIQKYYDNEIFGDIVASHILIKVNKETASTDEEKREVEKKAKETIKEILEKLKKGENFHELAKTYSEDDATKKNGGKLNAFNKGEMDKEFEKAVQKLEVGKYTTEAVKSAYGYHLILKESAKEKPALKDVKQTIIDNLIKEKINNDSKLQYKALTNLYKEYDVKINDDTLKAYYENVINNWLYSKEETK